MSATSQTPWLVRPQAVDQPRLRLFCLPHSGGSPTLFQRWADTLPPTVDLCAIQLPGRGFRFREAPYTRLEPLLSDLQDALRPYLDAPFAYFGHSLGALIAFELARALRQQGMQPRHLFVSACSAPHLPLGTPPLHRLSDDAFIDAIRRLNGTPPQLFTRKGLLELLLPAMRADMTVYETYDYQDAPPLDCPITAVGGREDPRVIPRELEGWREQTTARFRLQLFPGDHFFLNEVRSELLSLVCGELGL